jgi:hypothetical protein
VGDRRSPEEKDSAAKAERARRKQGDAQLRAQGEYTYKQTPVQDARTPEQIDAEARAARAKRKVWCCELVFGGYTLCGSCEGCGPSGQSRL